MERKRLRIRVVSLRLLLALLILAMLLPPAMIAPTVPLASAATPNPTEQFATATAQAGPPIAAGQTLTRETDGMVMVGVPAGEFQMGSEVHEQPVHPVALDAFWIDQTEVTNAQYRGCVQAGKCKDSDSERKDDVDFNGNRQPAVGVHRKDADAYCRWAGARLPTEAEWEYAARGPEGRVYPWGNEWDPGKLNSREKGPGKTTTVGSYPSGASWVGALDLAGNVFEWVADWYGPYSSERQVNPPGPSSGQYRVKRGGSWFNVSLFVRGAFRAALYVPWVGDIGFRCARSY